MFPPSPWPTGPHGPSSGLLAVSTAPDGGCHELPSSHQPLSPASTQPVSHFTARRTNSPRAPSAADPREVVSTAACNYGQHPEMEGARELVSASPLLLMPPLTEAQGLDRGRGADPDRPRMCSTELMLHYSVLSLFPGVQLHGAACTGWRNPSRGAFALPSARRRPPGFAAALSPSACACLPPIDPPQRN